MAIDSSSVAALERSVGDEDTEPSRRRMLPRREPMRPGRARYAEVPDGVGEVVEVGDLRELCHRTRFTGRMAMAPMTAHTPATA
jgi:hypothetical protein